MGAHPVYNITEEELDRYDLALSAFHRAMSEAHEVKKLLDQKKAKKEDLSRIGNLLRIKKDELIRAKEACGFDDGLLFMDDAPFLGFSIKDGYVTEVTDEEKLRESFEKWTSKWYDCPLESKAENHFLYEVAMFLFYALMWTPGLAERNVLHINY